MREGVVFNIQKFSVHDGPGLRTTVFLKGCNLRCRWCHNPESWDPHPQLLYFSEKCEKCGLCRQVCPTKGKDCVLCGDCAQVCVNGARVLSGRIYNVEQVMETVLSDRAFYEKSGGGVTFSGGECMLQPEFLGALLKACKREGISTAVDTAGCVPYDRFERILPDTDLVLFDIKCVSPELHRQFAGVDNGLILENYQRLLAAGARVWARIPFVPGFNDGPEMAKIRAFLAQNSPEKTEILPYHDLGVSKHAAAGYGPGFRTDTPTAGQLQTLRAHFTEAGL